MPTKSDNREITEQEKLDAVEVDTVEGKVLQAMRAGLDSMLLEHGLIVTDWWWVNEIKPKIKAEIDNILRR